MLSFLKGMRWEIGGFYEVGMPFVVPIGLIAVSSGIIYLIQLL